MHTNTFVVDPIKTTTTADRRKYCCLFAIKDFSVTELHFHKNLLKFFYYQITLLNTYNTTTSTTTGQGVFLY